jgi:dephospho-CoA kinase
MIIGLTGKNASGKGEVGKYLETKGFTFFSLSDVIRDELQKRNRPLTRDNLTQLGNELRKKGGTSVLADRILKKLDPSRNYVIDSFRNPDEVQAFKKRPDFTLISVEATQKTRYERMVARNREKDAQTFEDFVRIENRELNSNDPTKQNLNACGEMADHHIKNDGNLEDLAIKIDELLKSSPRRRPGSNALNIKKDTGPRIETLRGDEKGKGT